MPTGWGPRWSQSAGDPLPNAAGASVVPKRRRPPRPCGEGFGGPEAKEAPSPMRWGPRWPKAKEVPIPRGGGLGDPKSKEAPSPTQWGPR